MRVWSCIRDLKRFLRLRAPYPHIGRETTWRMLMGKPKTHRIRNCARVAMQKARYKGGIELHTRFETFSTFTHSISSHWETNDMKDTDGTTDNKGVRLALERGNRKGDPERREMG